MDKLTKAPCAEPIFHYVHTASRTFGAHDDNHQPLFQVRAGVRAETALAQVALLLKCAHETVYELTDCDHGNPGLVWSVVQSLESAQALIEAVLEGRSAPD